MWATTSPLTHPPPVLHSTLVPIAKRSVLIRFSSTCVAPESCGWYTADGVEQCGIKTFSLLNRAVSVIGLAGLDRRLAFKVVHELNGFLREYRASVVQRGYVPLLEQLTPGELTLPLRLGDQVALVQLVEFRASCFDAATRTQLLQQELKQWLTQMLPVVQAHLISIDRLAS